MFKVLEGNVPSTVESRIVSFLGCLSAQQSFILRVMSVIGTRGIEAELLEVRTIRPRQESPMQLTCLHRRRYHDTVETSTTSVGLLTKILPTRASEAAVVQTQGHRRTSW